MTLFDWVIIAVVVISIVTASAEGLVRELFSLGGVIAGLLLAGWMYWRVAPWFEPYVKSQAVAYAAGFLTVFCIVALVASGAGRAARWGVDKVGLKWMDRVLGGTFGLARGVVIGTALVLAAAAFTPEAEWLWKSEISRYLLLTARVAAWVAPGEVRQKFRQGMEVVRNHRMQGLAPTVGPTEQGAARSAGDRQ